MTGPAAGFVAVVPAAGASTRFGSMKLLADIRGEPLLQHTVRSLIDAGITRVVVVVSPDHALGAVQILKDDRIVLVTNPDPGRGMFSSIQTGLVAIDPGYDFVVLPADMPFVRTETVAALVADHHGDSTGTVATYGGRRGHPVVLPAGVRSALIQQPATTTLKHALVAAGIGLRDVDVADPGVLRDVDWKEDLR